MHQSRCEHRPRLLLPERGVQHSNDGAFWRQHTFNCLGPDGKAVDEVECHPDRQCYEEV